MRAHATLVAVVSVLASVLATASTPANADDTTSWRGVDGNTYTAAPFAVQGLDDQLYMGWDFDDACYVGGADKLGMDVMASIARDIRRSGRTVVWTIGPNKPSVVTQDLPSQLPHGECDAMGLQEQNWLLDNFSSPTYLPLRQRLLEDPRQTYWHTDGHWTSVGTSIYAKALASRLRHSLGAIQSYAPTTDGRYGDLAPGTFEAAPGEISTEAGSVLTTSGTDPLMGVSFDQSWQTRLPGRRLWPGRTLLIGDSFTFVGLENLRPIFASGRYLWFGHVPLRSIANAVVRSNTVVLEFLQRAMSDLTDLQQLRSVIHHALLHHSLRRR